jgi:mRNA-degrading endonuclease toxin of MazEF toxin-antitoxin module
VIISVANAEGQQSGLLFDSAVQCENLVTIDCKFIKRKVGNLSSGSMLEVDRALKTVLGLA